MIARADREYAGMLAAMLLGARVIREGPQVMQNPTAVNECAGAAAATITAIDRHLPPKQRTPQ